MKDKPFYVTMANFSNNDDLFDSIIMADNR